jgi:protoheme ferro-lyase
VTQTDQLLEILACVQACTDKPFEELFPLVMQHAQALSGAMCVFLAWDEAREKLVQDLENQGVPLLVLVLAPQVATPTVHTQIHFLQLDTLAQQLNQL